MLQKSIRQALYDLSDVIAAVVPDNFGGDRPEAHAKDVTDAYCGENTASGTSSLLGAVAIDPAWEARKQAEQNEWQRREARATALQIAERTRQPHHGYEQVVEAAKRYETYLSNTEAQPAPTLDRFETDELIRELSKRTI